MNEFYYQSPKGSRHLLFLMLLMLLANYSYKLINLHFTFSHFIISMHKSNFLRDLNIQTIQFSEHTNYKKFISQNYVRKIKNKGLIKIIAYNFFSSSLNISILLAEFVPNISCMRPRNAVSFSIITLKKNDNVAWYFRCVIITMLHSLWLSQTSSAIIMICLNLK